MAGEFLVLLLRRATPIPIARDATMTTTKAKGRYFPAYQVHVGSANGVDGFVHEPRTIGLRSFASAEDAFKEAREWLDGCGESGPECWTEPLALTESQVQEIQSVRVLRVLGWHVSSAADGSAWTFKAERDA